MLTAAAGCGSRTGLLAGDPDAQIEATGEAGGCTANSDCPVGDWCLFLVGDCSAQGQCLSPATYGPRCNAIVAYCGCDGRGVGGLCGSPYAFGPTPSADAASTCVYPDAGAGE
jgi:hypothetical protein